jgi:hypothetical protein
MNYSNITDDRLQKDNEIYNQMENLRIKSHLSHLSDEEKTELERLTHTYYVVNDDIRMYWKTY